MGAAHAHVRKLQCFRSTCTAYVLDEPLVTSASRSWALECAAGMMTEDASLNWNDDAEMRFLRVLGEVPVPLKALNIPIIHISKYLYETSECADRGRHFFPLNEELNENFKFQSDMKWLAHLKICRLLNRKWRRRRLEPSSQDVEKLKMLDKTARRLG